MAEAKYLSAHGDSKESRDAFAKLQEAEVLMWRDALLHEAGYTVFSIPFLTYPEMQSIMVGWISLQKKIHGAK